MARIAGLSFKTPGGGKAIIAGFVAKPSPR
jgi:hypothetical protein